MRQPTRSSASFDVYFWLGAPIVRVRELQATYNHLGTQVGGSLGVSRKMFSLRPVFLFALLASLALWCLGRRWPRRMLHIWRAGTNTHSGSRVSRRSNRSICLRRVGPFNARGLCVRGRNYSPCPRRDPAALRCHFGVASVEHGLMASSFHSPNLRFQATVHGGLRPPSSAPEACR